MSKGIYMGVGGVARKVKKLYAGVSGIPRKVKKVYVGVNGVPKLTYSEAIGVVNASIDGLSEPKSQIPRGTAGNYAVFAGGVRDSTYWLRASVDAYGPNLVHLVPASLNVARQNIVSGDSFNSHMFVTDGMETSSSWDYRRQVEVYSPSLTKFQPSNLTDLTNNGNIRANSTTTHAFFCEPKYGSIQPYNTSWVKQSTLYTSMTDKYVRCTGVSSYGLYAFNEAVHAISASLVRTVITALSSNHLNGSAVRNGSYGMFIAGSSLQLDKVIECYDSNLVKTQTTSISFLPASAMSCCTEDFAMLKKNDFTYTAEGRLTETIDNNLTVKLIDNLPVERSMMSLAQAGDKIIVAGGMYTQDYNNSLTTVEAYEF